MNETIPNVSEIIPYESYRLNYDKAELDEIRRTQLFSIIRRPVIAVVLMIFILLPTLLSDPQSNALVFCSAFIFIIALSIFITVKNHNKAWSSSIERIASSTYGLDFYDSYAIIKVYRNGELIKESKCYYNEFECIHNSEKWLFLVIYGQTYIIRKSDLKENSLLYSYMYGNANKTKVMEPLNINNFISVILFFASIYSIFIALTLMNKLTSVNGLFVENTWVFFTLTPLPISSIIFGCILKSKGKKYKLNFITGIIITAFLCIYGSFVFIF